MRIKSTTKVPPKARFWTFVDTSTSPHGCWLWTGGTSQGYGHFRLSTHVQVMAHRYAWELVNEPIPPGLMVCHTCDQYYPFGDTSYRLCVNPAHMELGTQTDNMRHAAEVGRTTYGERSTKAKLTAAQATELRSLRAEGMTYKELGARFGITFEHAYRIVAGKFWNR